MLVLAVAGLLALGAPPDTALRVPGTPLRFGATEAALADRGFASAAPGVRHGRVRFFGIESVATLTLTGDRLARAEFEVDSVAPYQVAYVEDQLAGMGYKRRCERLTEQSRSCDWSGPARVHLELASGVLRATLEAPWAGGLAPVEESGPAGPAGSAMNRGELLLARLRGEKVPGLDSAMAASRPAGGGPAASSRPDSARGAARPDSARLAAARDTARPPALVAVGPVPVLPETLAVLLPGRTSRYASAGAVSKVPCDYPDAARDAGVQGRVWLHILVDVDGRVREAHVIRGAEDLKAGALDCARRWRFRPLTSKGVPCRYWVEADIAFTLH